MTNLAEKIYKENGYALHVIPNKKHKTIALTAKLRAPLRRETVTKRALIPYVLEQGTEALPSSTRLQERLDSLYGAGLSVGVSKKGNNHIISVRLEIANDKFINGESNLLPEAVHLLNEVIFNPNRTGDCFEEKVVEREKETLRQKIGSIVDNKMSYANMRLIDEMCKGEPYQLHVHGYLEDLNNISAKSLYTYYRSALIDDQLDIFVAGDVDTEQIKQIFMQHINRERNIVTNNGASESKQTIEKVKTVTEHQTLKQAKLHLGYRTHISYDDHDYAALQVFNGLFGGFPSSKLFMNVREKNSLAYYASSQFESHKGLLFVFSGIAPEDYEKAKDIMIEQKQALENGDFIDKEIEETKSLIVNQLFETMDNAQGMIELFYQQVIAGSTITPQHLIQAINQVSKEEIVAVAKKVQLDTIYLLTADRRGSDE